MQQSEAGFGDPGTPGPGPDDPEPEPEDGDEDQKSSPENQRWKIW